MRPWWWICLTCLLGAGLLAACAPSKSTSVVFVPPTAARSATEATPSASMPPPPRASATPQCTPQLRYLEDLSIPDGSIVQPGETLDKRWAVENAGNCNWDASYSLRLIAGPAMGAPESMPLYPARAGTQAVIRILFTAPQANGIYRSAWQAFDPRGVPFGDPIFIEIQVGGP